MPDRRDSEAPRDEPQPLTKEEREMHVNLSRRVVQAGYPTYSRGYVSDAAVILAYEATVQRLEAEKRALVRFAGEIHDDYDHDSDAHRYKTGTCRKCNAEAALAAYLTP